MFHDAHSSQTDKSLTYIADNVARTPLSPHTVYVSKGNEPHADSRPTHIGVFSLTRQSDNTMPSSKSIGPIHPFTRTRTNTIPTRGRTIIRASTSKTVTQNSPSSATSDILATWTTSITSPSPSLEIPTQNAAVEHGGGSKLPVIIGPIVGVVIAVVAIAGGILWKRRKGRAVSEGGHAHSEDGYGSQNGGEDYPGESDSIEESIEEDTYNDTGEMEGTENYGPGADEGMGAEQDEDEDEDGNDEADEGMGVEQDEDEDRNDEDEDENEHENEHMDGDEDRDANSQAESTGNEAADDEPPADGPSEETPPPPDGPGEDV